MSGRSDPSSAPVARERKAARAIAHLVATGCFCVLLSGCWVFDNPVDPLNAGSNSGVDSGGAPGTSPSASMDTIPPTVSGSVASSMSGPDTVQLSWSAATDNSTLQSNLQYEVVDSTTAITTLAQAQAATVAVGWTANLTSASVAVSSWDTAAGSFHYFAVLTKDLAGNVSMYPVAKRKVELYDIVAVVGSASGSASPGTHVFFNDGNGNFTQGAVLSVATSGYSNLALGNLTSHAAPADGGPAIDDIFVTNNNVSPNEVWQNQGGGTFKSTPISESWSTAPSTAVALGPIFGVAGEIDAFVANSNAASTVWQDAGGSGTFTAASESNLGLTTTNASVALAMGNLSGSGGSAQDVFVANNGQTNLVWQDLAGTGTYSAWPESSLVANDCSSGAAVADLNGDGIPDVFVANSGSSGAGGQNYVYLNSSTASTLGAPTAVGPSKSVSTAVALGDLNGDGMIDAFVVNSGSPDTVWGNNGAGTFTQIAEPAFTGMTDQGTDVVLGDLNGDGILDAVVSSGGANGTIKVWLGNGDGTFTQVAEPNIPSGDYVAVAIGRLR